MRPVTRSYGTIPPPPGRDGLAFGLVVVVIMLFLLGVGFLIGRAVR